LGGSPVRTRHTLAVNQELRPVGLVPVEDVVSRLAIQELDRRVRVRPLIVDQTRRWRSQHLDLATPLVVEWPGWVELTEGERTTVSRRVLFARDQYRCAYCDFVAQPLRALKDLTVDHVKPACLFPSRAVATTWDNVVAACRPCNQRKADRLPYECHMYPRRTPKQPTFVQLRFAGHGLHPVQRDYIRDFFSLEEGDLVF
jgi:5-methylcytosine-specific restriction endonuclease McrA